MNNSNLSSLNDIKINPEFIWYFWSEKLNFLDTLKWAKIATWKVCSDLQDLDKSINSKSDYAFIEQKPVLYIPVWDFMYDVFVLENWNPFFLALNMNLYQTDLNRENAIFEITYNIQNKKSVMFFIPKSWQEVDLYTLAPKEILTQTNKLSNIVYSIVNK